ncbi:unnamed protein product [marine sediment metagenome]|uniref:Uncharacterized protein n=2 Tax=marine sediment metagenome TaxID=412755 RepID=X1QZP0_9ZZZZ
MTKKRKPGSHITCPVCKKKFYYSAKASPIGRLSKHIRLKHPRYKRKKPKRKATSKQRVSNEKNKSILELLRIAFSD